MHVIPVGVDSETKRGKPITFQFYSEELPENETICWVRNSGNASRIFLAFCDSLPNTRDRHYIFFGHNLGFDLVSFLYDRREYLRNESFDATWHGWRVHVIYAAVRFAVLRKGHKQITVIDTGAYFSSPARTLKELAEIFCPQLPKLDPPAGLGQRDFTPKNKKFCAYAMRDSVIAYNVGKFILARHAEWDISLAVSGPHFASKVFRRHFLKRVIPLPPRRVVYAALSSYHGGKNNITAPAGLHKNIVALDIKSAYPAAMATFPSFSDASLYRAISGNGHPDRALPEFAIYRISGTAKSCKWPALYDHNFKPLVGSFSNVWVTGFELNEALRMREVRIDSLFGYYYAADKDREPSPFKAYVEEFYARKETAKDKPMREFNKLLMNALYGKFIQTRAAAASMQDLVFDLEEGKLIEDSSILAGGMFNPFVATLITGHTRATIHRLEHKHKALHTSTDGIQALRRNVPSPSKYRGAKSLGSVSIEAAGDLLLFRNKLYIIYGSEGKKESAIFKGKRIVKYALHGFHGNVHALEKIWQTGIKEYEYTKVNKLRESLRRNLQVNDFVSSKATLQLELPQR